MTLELLHKRLADLDKAIQQAQANFNALEGSRQECLYWIEQTEKASAKEEVK